MIASRGRFCVRRNGALDGPSDTRVLRRADARLTDHEHRGEFRTSRRVEAEVSAGELSSGEDGTDDHGAATPRTAPRRSGRRRGWRRCPSEQTPGEGESSGSTRIGEIAKLPNAHEAAREHVLHEASEKLQRGERHRATLTVMRVVLPAKGDALAIKREQAVIADRDTMGIPTEIAQTAAGPPKAGFA